MQEQIVTKQLESGCHQGEQMIIKLYAYAFTQTGKVELLNNLNWIGRTNISMNSIQDPCIRNSLPRIQNFVLSSAFCISDHHYKVLFYHLKLKQCAFSAEISTELGNVIAHFSL